MCDKKNCFKICYYLWIKVLNDKHRAHVNQKYKNGHWGVNETTNLNFQVGKIAFKHGTD